MSTNSPRFKVGSTVFSIYKNSKSFTLAWVDSVKRNRKTFQTIKLCKEYAKRVKTTNLPRSLTLSGSELNEYSATLDILNDYAHRLDLESRPRIDTLVQEAVNQREQSNKLIQHKTTGEILNELIAHKKALRRSKSTLLALNPLRDFVDQYPQFIDDVAEQDILAWNSKIIPGRSQRTVYNYQAVVLELFNYAQIMGYLPEGKNAANILTKKAIRAKKGVEEVELWDCEHLPKLFKAASNMKTKSSFKDVTIMVALAALAGCRIHEIAKMQWQHVLWKTGYLKVPAYISKNNKANRRVPMSDSLRAWLVYAGGGEDSIGPIASSTSQKYISKQLESVSRNAELKHVRNGYRHTCISAWLACGHEIGHVAMICDNSPAVIKSNYLGEITKEEGEEWHSIMP